MTSTFKVCHKDRVELKKPQNDVDVVMYIGYTDLNSDKILYGIVLNS